MGKSNISIIIPTYNKKNRIKYLLKSLAFQAKTVNFDIIIVDDGSTDGTEENIYLYKDKLKLDYIKIKNSGRSHARNVGIECSNTKYLIFCDDDMILPIDFIEKHYQLLEGNSDALIHGKIYNLPFASFFEDPEYGTLVPQKKHMQNEINHLLKYKLNMDDVCHQEKLIPQRRITMQEKYIKRMYEKDIKQLFFLLCTGGNFSCKKEDVVSIGMFDENIDVAWGVEDLELGYRFMMTGKQMIYADEAYNYHISHYREDYAQALTGSCELFYQKHKNPILAKLPDLLLKKISLEDFISNYTM